MKQTETSHSKKAIYGTGFDSSSYQSLLVPGSKGAEHIESNDGSSSATQEDKYYHPANWTEDHKRLADQHPRIVNAGREVIKTVDGLKLGALEQAKYLLEHGTPPTIGDHSDKRAKDNTAYKFSIDQLKRVAPLAKEHREIMEKHAQQLRDSSHPDRKMIDEAMKLSSGLHGSHNWATRNHPHEIIKHDNLSEPMSNDVKRKHIATIEEKKKWLTEHLKEHS
jgi:hypothetical protein